MTQTHTGYEQVAEHEKVHSLIASKISWISLCPHRFDSDF